jgi:tryptophan halogenase
LCKKLNKSKYLNIKQIVILGGGTAGWLAANHLAKKLNLPGGIDVTLIESPNIPTIGVGEGTVPAMRESLKYLGIDEGEFISRCDATFKQSIKFVNWTYDPNTHGQHSYHHLFDYPLINQFNSTPYWLQQNNNLSFAQTVAVQGAICDLGLGPKKITDPQYQGQTAYAYHLDAAKFSQLLTENAVEKLGVKHIKDDVLDATLKTNGDIASLVTMQHGEITGDVFIDCSGFNSLLMGEKLGVKFIDKSDVLFADHALAIQVPYTDMEQPIASHTIATAQQSGWIWDIGLTKRRGVGHVYSSNHTSHEQAERDLRRYLGSDSDDLAARKIKMHIGYREKFWHKNCVALGLSQGFVEPLEATGLLVFDATARMLAEQFPTDYAAMAYAEKRFNQRIRHTWDRVIDFIKLHYCISKRRDSAFWLDNTHTASIPEALQENLEYWRYHMPSEYDFHNKLSIFNLDNYLYVLYGMDFKTDISSQVFQYNDDQAYQQWLVGLEQYRTQLSTQLPKHRDLIDKIKQYGIQSL